MAGRGPMTARRVALGVLDQFNPDRGDSRRILHRVIDRTDRKAHATDLVFGVIRNRNTIDMIIARSGGAPIERIAGRIVNILRIGVYELIYVPTTGDYAVVNEAVNLAHVVAGKKQSGFVNAVLRNVGGAIARRATPLRTAGAQNTLPHSPTHGCQFDMPVLSNPQTDPAAWLAEAFSLPQWLTGEWLDEFGFEKSKQICFASNRRPGLYIQPNTLKISLESLAKKFADAEIEFEIVAGETMLRIRSRRAIASAPGFSEGLFIVQDPTAAGVAKILSPQPGQNILDLCAAPGGKAVGMAQLMGGRGSIVASDIDSERLKMVCDNCARLGITIIDPVAWDKLSDVIAQVRRWDAVVVDVPCSNTGVMAKRPEVRFRITPRAIRSLVETQRRLLDRAAGIVGGGGKICYSTCSIQRAENAALVRAFLKDHPNFKLDYEKLTLPFVLADQSFDYDGGFTAILTRRQ
ncbi:MAG: hypothetical protein DRP66_04695 [Planctomycetota bacterium]|nr:MAG: hypothetical protein DRP66_04695 [Planctomycetota bacterium]